MTAANSTSSRWQPALLRRFLPLVQQDLSATYSRNLHKWLIIAPLIGVLTGLTITLVAVAVLREMWPPVLAYYLHHHWAIVPGLVAFLPVWIGVICASFLFANGKRAWLWLGALALAGLGLLWLLQASSWIR